MGELLLDGLRRVVLAFPEVNERVSHGAVCFFIRDKVALCYFHDNHRGDGRVSLWCPAPAGVPREMVENEPERFFAPPTSARGAFSGWLGVYLDGTGPNRVDWPEIRSLIDEAYQTVSPTKLAANSTTDTGPRRRRPASKPPHRFQAELWMHTGDSAWHFVTLPVDVADKIEGVVGPTHRGFGSVSVRVTIGTTTWRTSIFPDTSAGSYVLPIKKAVRGAEGLHAGDLVSIDLEPALAEPATPMRRETGSRRRSADGQQDSFPS